MIKPTMTCIQTYSGILIDLANPREEDILLPDIAHHLSNTCRYTGACRKSYSVAQHCILVSKLIEDNNPPLKLIGLLHDASEAYLGDISTPLKTMLPEYRKIEEKFQQLIIKRFQLGIKDFSEVKVYDRMALDFESKVLMAPRHPVWDNYKVAFPEGYDLDWSLMEILPMEPIDAELQYLATFNKLCNRGL